MIHSESSIHQDSAAYRRGVVLGMTMAEIFLLLLFCLLIAAAVLFRNAEQARQQMAEQAEQQEQEIAGLRRTLEQITELQQQTVDGDGQPRPEETWRKLVEDQVVLNQAREAGLDVESLTRYANDIEAVQPLLQQGTTGASIAANNAYAEQVRQAVERVDLSGQSPQQLASLAQAGAALDGEGEHNWPPIVNLSEAGGYSFETGRAELSDEFRSALDGPIIDQVAEIVARYDASVVEVVGHTDERNLPGRTSNLDQSLFRALADELPIGSLSPSDNAGLGMARAVSVARILRNDQRLKGVTVLPLSGGQLIRPGDSIAEGVDAGDEATRRRIEIRVRRPG